MIFTAIFTYNFTRKREKSYTFKYLLFLYLDGQESRPLPELDKEPVYIVGVFVFVVHNIVAFH